jgi:pSer/pThr/pTyr-binding forkhead associated (FHA) protein
MSEQLPGETIDARAETALDHESTNFLRRYEVALVVLEGSQAGENIWITGLPFLVGRGKNSTMALTHESVSRDHAEIHLGTGGQLELVDKGSSNGSFVNSERIESSALEDGDRIRFGSVRYQLLVEERGPVTYVAD